MNGLQAVLAVGSLGALFCAGCAPPAQEQKIEFRVPVTAREVGTGDVEDRIVATGSLRTAETIALRAQTAGSLVIARNASGRRLREGDRVVANQPIAEITGEEVRLAARTEATTQRYEAALRDYESKKKLLDDGLISEEQFRPVETALTEARIELDQSRLTETRSTLVTPIPGVVLHLCRDENDLPVADGQLVREGFVIAQVAPTDALVAEVDLVGPDVARVKEGQPARIRHHAWEGQVFEGRVVRLAPTLDPVTRTLRAEVAVDNADGDLRPGMFVEVTMIAESRQGVLVVPREAMVERGGRKVVFVLQGQHVNRRPVVPGLGDDEIVEIRQGLEAGERIVVRGLETLTDGTKVQVSGG